jgi:hypothetical protein
VLLGVGLFSVLTVKTAHSGVPKQLCLGELKSRNNSVWYKLEFEVNGTKRSVCWWAHGQGVPGTRCIVLYLLVRDTMQRYCSRLVGGEQQFVVYTLEQPKMHALYHSIFNAVDVMNRLSQGPVCLSSTWSTYHVRHRLFAASLSTYNCVTYAYSAWLQVYQLTNRHSPQK